MFIAGTYVFIVWSITGTSRHWWLWLTALILMATVDGIMGVIEEDVPKYKTQTQYRRR